MGLTTNRRTPLHPMTLCIGPQKVNPDFCKSLDELGRNLPAASTCLKVSFRDPTWGLPKTRGTFLRALIGRIMRDYHIFEHGINHYITQTSTICLCSSPFDPHNIPL